MVFSGHVHTHGAGQVLHPNSKLFIFIFWLIWIIHIFWIFLKLAFLTRFLKVAWQWWKVQSNHRKETFSPYMLLSCSALWSCCSCPNTDQVWLHWASELWQVWASMGPSRPGRGFQMTKIELKYPNNKPIQWLCKKPTALNNNKIDKLNALWNLCVYKLSTSEYQFLGNRNSRGPLWIWSLCLWVFLGYLFGCCVELDTELDGLLFWSSTNAFLCSY